jgi:hypothetical protein
MLLDHFSHPQFLHLTPQTTTLMKKLKPPQCPWKPYLEHYEAYVLATRLSRINNCVQNSAFLCWRYATNKTMDDHARLPSLVLPTVIDQVQNKELDEVCLHERHTDEGNGKDDNRQRESQLLGSKEPSLLTSLGGSWTSPGSAADFFYIMEE